METPREKLTRLLDGEPWGIERVTPAGPTVSEQITNAIEEMIDEAVKKALGWDGE